MIDLSSIENNEHIDEQEQNIQERIEEAQEQPNNNSLERFEYSEPIAPDYQPIAHVPPPMDNNEREGLVLTLKLMLNRFGKGKLKQYRGYNVDNMCDSELLELKDKFIYVLSCSNNVDLSIDIFMRLLTLVEFGLDNFSPLQVEGWVDNIKNDEEIIDDLYLIIIEHFGAYKFMDPKTRLALNLGKSLFAQHEFNKNKKENIITQENNISSINNNFSDI